MIDKAKKQFSNIEFLVCDALAVSFEEDFDVVFSNAVFHWISDHDRLLKNIYKALKPHGRLVCEFVRMVILQRLKMHLSKYIKN